MLIWIFHPVPGVPQLLTPASIIRSAVLESGTAIHALCVELLISKVYISCNLCVLIGISATQIMFYAFNYTRCLLTIY